MKVSVRINTVFLVLMLLGLFHLVWSMPLDWDSDEVKKSKKKLSASIYEASLNNLSTEENLFLDLTEYSDFQGQIDFVQATSKTCSQRCSKSCSKSCTTTRGCSRLCKSYTEGCTSGGSSTQGSNDTTKTKVGQLLGGVIPRPASTEIGVKDFQMLLNVAGYSVPLIGEIDEKTKEALKDFQSKNGLVSTGTPNRETWRKLCVALEYHYE